jgi:hypothetical protein
VDEERIHELVVAAELDVQHLVTDIEALLRTAGKTIDDTVFADELIRALTEDAEHSEAGIPRGCWQDQATHELFGFAAEELLRLRAVLRGADISRPPSRETGRNSSNSGLRAARDFCRRAPRSVPRARCWTRAGRLLVDGSCRAGLAPLPGAGPRFRRAERVSTFSEHRLARSTSHAKRRSEKVLTRSAPYVDSCALCSVFIKRSLVLCAAPALRAEYRVKHFANHATFGFHAQV